MEGFRVGGNKREMLSIDKIGEYKTGVKYKITIRERLALRSNVKDETHLEIYGGLREGQI